MNTKSETIAKHFLKHPELLPKFIEEMNKQGHILLQHSFNPEKISVSDKYGSLYITTKKEFTLLVDIEGKRKFNITLDGEELRVSGYNNAIQIEPRASNLVHITEKKRY